MPRFVIQHHRKQGQDDHWDLMLEEGEILKTFQLNLPPDQVALHPAQATPIFDHELRFLTYEGPVNQGLGQVTIAEHGSYRIRQKTASRWELNLEGTLLQGTFVLEQKPPGQWRFQRPSNSDRP